MSKMWPKLCHTFTLSWPNVWLVCVIQNVGQIFHTNCVFFSLICGPHSFLWNRNRPSWAPSTFLLNPQYPHCESHSSETMMELKTEISGPLLVFKMWTISVVYICCSQYKVFWPSLDQTHLCNPRWISTVKCVPNTRGSSSDWQKVNILYVECEWRSYVPVKFGLYPKCGSHFCCSALAQGRFLPLLLHIGIKDINFWD